MPKAFLFLFFCVTEYNREVTYFLICSLVCQLFQLTDSQNLFL